MDAILLCGLHAHTHADPIPDLSPDPRVVAWAEGGAFEAAASASDAALAEFPHSTPFAQHVLTIGAAQYAPFVVENARALAEGRKAFEIETYGEGTSYLTRAYSERSRQMIGRRISDQLTRAERRDVEAWLEEAGLACFLP